MALGGEIHHVVRRVRLEQAPQLGPVADVDAGEAIAGVVRGLRNRVQIRGVSQLVDIDDVGLGLVEQMPDHGRADEACAAGDEKLWCRETACDQSSVKRDWAKERWMLSRYSP